MDLELAPPKVDDPIVLDARTRVDPSLSPSIDLERRIRDFHDQDRPRRVLTGPQQVTRVPGDHGEVWLLLRCLAHGER